MSDDPAPLTVRLAGQRDVPTLAAMNAHLMEDQGAQAHSQADLVTRMSWWLAEEYQAAVAEADGEPVGYALWRWEDGSVFLRQLFVSRAHRRERVGQRLFTELTRQFWPGAVVTLNVFVDNARAEAFWRSLGFADYSLLLRRPPEQ